MADRYHRRFGVMFRVQHGILFVSVLLAIVTGLPMKFPDAWLSRATVVMMGGVEMRALLHHIAGLTMTFLGVFHLIYYLFIDRGIPFYKRPVLFRPRDFADLYQHQRFNLGLTREFPRMGRYTWFEKFDYIGVMWGIGVMSITGLPMLFMDQALLWMPLSWLQALWAAHSEEAMLATMFLLVIHLYNTHFSPERFPMSLTWWNGKISVEEMEKYHPLELEELEARERQGPPASPEPEPSSAIPAETPEAGPSPQELDTP